MSGAPDLLGIATAASGFGGSFALVFVVLRWIVATATARHDRRQAALDAEHGALDQSWKSYRMTLERELGQLRSQIEAVRYAFHIVSGALVKVDPGHPALSDAARMLNIAFPADFSLDAARAEEALRRQGG